MARVLRSKQTPTKEQDGDMEEEYSNSDPESESTEEEEDENGSQGSGSPSPQSPHLGRRRNPVDSKPATSSRTPSPTSARRTQVAAASTTKRQRTFDEHFEDYVKREKELEQRGALKTGKSFDRMGIDPGEGKTMDDYEYKGLSRRKNSGLINWLYYHSKRLTRLSIFHYAAIAVTISAIGFGIYFNFLKGTNESTTVMSNQATEKLTWDDAQNKFHTGFMQLVKRFKSQQRETNVHLFSAINSTMSFNEPKQPSALTIMIPPSMLESQFPMCFVQKIASMVNQIFSRVLETDSLPAMIIDGKFFERHGEDITGIHDQLNAYFRRGGRVVIVKDVEKIKEENHLLIFHALCDNYKAPEKRATIFFLLPVTDDVLTQFSWKYQFASEISNYVFERSWRLTTNDDSRPAMIARIAANVVMLDKGDSC